MDEHCEQQHSLDWYADQLCLSTRYVANTVNTICPGYFITPLTKETLESDYFAQYAKTVIPMERYGHEGELDSAVVFLASDASTYVTGVALPVDGGYTCV